MAASLIAALSVAALAGGAAAVNARAARREARARRSHPPLGQIIALGDRQIHAVVQGAGPDLVLLHGASGNLRDFTFAFAPMMAAQGFRVISFDRPGLGYSGRGDDRHDGFFSATAESPGEQAALLARAAATLGADRPLVLGHSYGGAVALAWALDHPAAALVVLSGVALPWPGGLGLWYAINGSALGGALVPPLVSAFASGDQVARATLGIFAPDPVPDGYLDHIGPGLITGRSAFRANARQVVTLYPHVVAMAARYPGLTLPVELVHGDADTIVPLSIHAARAVDIIPGAALTVLPGIGHMPHHAAAPAVAAAIHRAAIRAGLRPGAGIPIV